MIGLLIAYVSFSTLYVTVLVGSAVTAWTCYVDGDTDLAFGSACFALLLLGLGGLFIS